MYYLQSRYYDPAVGRFINADSYASTGQGIIGHNMYTYCGNNPINYVDLLGCIPSAYMRIDPNPVMRDGKAASIEYVRIPSPSLPDVSFSGSYTAYKVEQQTPYGSYSINALSGETSTFTVSDSGVSLLSADLTYTSLEWQAGAMSLKPIDYLSLEADIGTSGVMAMVSIWNPSVSFSLGDYNIALTGHVGALGGGITWKNGVFSIGLAPNGVGGSVSISRQ